MKYSTSLFAQILQELPRADFERLLIETKSERNSKGFSSWTQCVAMLFCQLAQAHSLREISDGLAITCGKLNHLGVKSSPPKSTLGYANAQRPAELFEGLFMQCSPAVSESSPVRRRSFASRTRSTALMGL